MGREGQKRTFLERVERTTHLIAIAARHGFGSLLALVGWSVPAGSSADAGVVNAEQFRDALAEAGATFVKLGQRLSTRPDLLPSEYVKALATLQEDVPAPPVEELLAVLVEELGRPLEEVFAEFDREPVAAASIGVVFKARLPEPDGRWVAVKVQRPGVARQVAVDLHILADLAAGLQRHVPALRRYQPVQLVREFREAMHAELDYLEEAARTRRLREALLGHRGVCAPDVLMHLTTSRVLTLEWVEGAPVTDEAALAALGADRARIAHDLALSLFKQALVEGCFHGDPHAGNIRLLPDKRAAFLDFGSVTYVGRAAREQIQRLLGAMFLQRADLLTTALVNAGMLGPEVDAGRFERDLDRMLARHFNSGGMTAFEALLQDFLRLVFAHQALILPPEWVSLLQSVCMLEDVCRRLDPDFRMQTIGLELTRPTLAPHIEDWHGWLRENLLTAQGFSELVAGLPGRAERLLTRLESGDLRLSLEHSASEEFWRPLSRIVNRLTGGIVVSALVLATALLAARAESGLIGAGWRLMFALAAAGGLALLISMIRSARRH